ncbi:UPF0488 protein CG14286-like [Haliotis rufescens]|uniref:UPF0488 protein CG14286-like n=1 Tax=Haliotis rufescens TaxID=6454 RepID=UPI00201FB1CF|nr:UPF0488 protein CG14286-like [Haliotis rufescens]
MDQKKQAKPKSKKNKAPKPAPDKTPEPEEEEDDDEPLEVRFEREVAWCKEQLFLKLHQVKLDSKQGFDLARAMKILDSDKAPMIKKRQAMRTTLGDYRKKMKEDEKKRAAAAKKIVLKPADESQTKLSKCLKLSSSQQQQKMGDGSGSVDEKLTDLSLTDSKDQSANGSDKRSENLDSQSAAFKFETSDNQFRFNFTGKGKVDEKVELDGESIGT